MVNHALQPTCESALSGWRKNNPVCQQETGLFDHAQAKINRGISPFR
jgi:hypothetical protein